MTDPATPKPPRPAPVVTSDNDFYWEAATAGRLVIQRCSDCGRLRHPPRPMCPHCGSVEWDTVDASGRGIVYTYALLHHPQHPAFDYPVISAIVELDEGPRLVTQLVDLAPEDVRIGLRVRVRFAPTAHDLAVPVFTPADA